MVPNKARINYAVNDFSKIRNGTCRRSPSFRAHILRATHTFAISIDLRVYLCVNHRKLRSAGPNILFPTAEERIPLKG